MNGLTELDATPSQVRLPLLDRDKLTDAAAQVQSAPIRQSPIRQSPIRQSPIRQSPIRQSPIRQSPLDDANALTGTAAITLAQVPLTPPLDWTTVLQGTEFEGLPLQTVLISQVLTAADSRDSKYAEIRKLILGNIDFSDTSLGEVGLGSFLLGDTPLTALPAPTGAGSTKDRWCAYLASHGTSTSPRCDASQALIGKASLMLVELAGVALTDYYAEDGALIGSDLVDAPLAFVRVADLALGRIALGNVTLEQLKESIRKDICPACTDADNETPLRSLNLPKSTAPPADPVESPARTPCRPCSRRASPTTRSTAP